MANEVEVLVVASKIRSYLKGKDVKMSGELVDALNKRVMWLLDEAVKRTQGNKRATVKSYDI